MSDPYISPQELQQQLATGAPPLVIDVRGDEEYVAGHIQGAWHIPGETLPDRLAEIPPDRTIVPY